MAAHTDNQAETIVYVVWRPPLLETTDQWIESCKPLRAR
jgi:hypothetical protein